MSTTAAPPIDDGATYTGIIIGSQLNPGDLLGGRFRIESLIGIGGMGVVYRARDLSLDIDVALKLLRPELARRPESFESFRRELLLARQVSSPHVVRIHDIAEDAGRWFISMDYIAGESLEHRLDRKNALPLAQALAITQGLLDGLGAAHGRGVVHRDLKPANVLINEEGHAYISDFGIARSLGATGLTQTGMIVGTPEYLSPEQARGQTVDARSDLYAVGLILYEMLVGELPFSGGTPAETVIQRILRPPPSLAKARPDLPRWLHAFADRLLKVNPAHRFDSAKVALRAMESRKVPRAPMNMQRVAAVAAVIVLVAAAGTWFWRNPGALSRWMTPAVTETPRIAVLPFTATAGDADLTALARGLDAHLHAWLRDDPALAAVPRRRVLDALARVAPDAGAESLARQLPEIARAADATRLWSGGLSRASDGALRLVLTESGDTATKPVLDVRGANAAELFAGYRRAVADWFAHERWHAGGAPVSAAPVLADDALLPLGTALLALDKQQPAAAANALAAIPAGTSALLESTRLAAQEADNEELPAQNTRRAALQQFAAATDATALELVAQAAVGEDDSAKAAAAVAAAAQAFPHDTAIALQSAQAEVANGDSDKALVTLKRVVAEDGQDARAWFLLGRTAIQQGQPRIAVEDYLTHALVLYARAGNTAAEAETRNALGIGYDRLGQADAAIEQYTRAAAMREKLGDEAGLGKTLRNLAVVQSVSGQRDAAEKTLDRAKAILEKLGDRASLADLHNDRGVVAEESGDFSAALAAYREALAIRQQLDVPNLVAESLDNVGFASFQLGRFDDALVYWQQALALYQKVDDRNKTFRVEQNIAVLDTSRGHFAAARERLEKLLRAAQDAQLTEAEAVAQVNLAELALAQGEFAQAATFAERAGQIFQRRSDQRGYAEATLLAARVQLALGNAAAADTFLRIIQPDQLGPEQKSAYLLASAQREALAGDAAKANVQLGEAASAAAESHSGAIDMRIRLQRVRMALAARDHAGAAKLLKSIGAETSRLNEVALRLQWLELAIADALLAHDRTQAVAGYRQALAAMKDLDGYAGAATIHALGARALPPGAEADAARAAADAVRTKLLAQAPENARSVFATDLDRRLHEETGDADAR